MVDHERSNSQGSIHDHMQVMESHSFAASSLNNNNNNNASSGLETDLLPNDLNLTLLCLDHLRELRRSQTPLLDHQYLSVAVWALQRAVSQTSALQDNTDCWCEPKSNGSALPKNNTIIHQLPIVQLEKEFLEDDDDYPYDDLHPSNACRYFRYAGLDEYPLSLGELVVAGSLALHSQTRLTSQAKMIQSPLFESFYQAVQKKDFFTDPNQYEDRYQKVLAKFRNKLVDTVAEPGSEYIEQAVQTYQQHKQQERFQQDTPKVPTNNNNNNSNTDLEQAEHFKNMGNLSMQKKEYQAAADYYSQALQLNPHGQNSHVYFSNRAAALVSMKQFEAAVADSERSLALKPDYPKAHARLGLAYFLLGQYRPSMEAYTVALKYEPGNKSSQSYLEKAARKLAESSDGTANNTINKSASSFSVVSEWEQSKVHRSNTGSEQESEHYKTLGNSCMANREYQSAYDHYSTAIRLCRDGPHSHVYYSNRAAALCYLERYQDAEADSLHSVCLKPSYGKAHARLGLSRFFLQNYQGAILAYGKSLQLDPTNAASQSYLQKAQAKLREQEQNGV